MELILRNGMLIRDVQKQFNDLYPYLKIEFFREKQTAHQLSPKNGKLDQNSSLDAIRYPDATCTLAVDEEVTVGQLEQDFWEKTGLAAQVFRKSGNLWIETSLTDDWTLEKQNRLAELLMHPMDKPRDPQSESKI